MSTIRPFERFASWPAGTATWRHQTHHVEADVEVGSAIDQR